jgi:drug/metabolite transporter (DMT)-like permease
MTPQRVLYAKLLFAVVVWGASFIATKVALQNGLAPTAAALSGVAAAVAAPRPISPITVIWLRFGIGVAVLGVAVLARRQFAAMPGREAGYFALLGFLGITFHQWLQSNGLVTAQATTTAWIVATTPIFIALLGRLVLGERLGWLRAAGIGLAAAGVLLVVTRGDLSTLSVGRLGAPGDALILVSAPNWALFSILSRRGLRDYPAARMVFFVMAFGWLFASVLLAAGPGLSELGDLTLAGWLGVAFLGVFCSGLAYIFWYDALERIPASQVGAFLYLEPLVTVAVAALVLGEPLALAALAGGAIILAGVWLVQRPALSRR